MNEFDWTSDFTTRMRFSVVSNTRSHAIIPREPGALPEPLEDAAAAMDNAKTSDEAKMAADVFLTLSEEWVDSGR